nr:SDR family NAD(P)-dependent oxidoreductase [Paenibacillus hamazuiensis]
MSQVAGQKLSKEEAKALLLELTSAEVAIDKDIAVIGLAGKFPQAENAEAFWKLLREGVNCIREYPAHRLKDFEPILQNPYYTEFMFGRDIQPEDFAHIHVKAGYMDNIDRFDADFFGIPRSEATYMDPSQRLALETAWEAMEDAGYGGDTLIGSRTGVYIGKDGTNYSYYRLCSFRDPMQLTGSWESLIASRISYLYDFKGPCMIIDTACSAGLISVHMAAQALLAGECDQAIAGGVNLFTTGELKARFLEGANMGNVESDDSAIRTFDARANGTVWGEGVGLVMLKPLQRAIADGDNIRAIIKASVINNDGSTNSLTAPSAKTQEEAIFQAWEKAGISPETVSYIEAHGTGTVLGDPIEIKGLTSAFRRYTSRKQFCAIGSLKTNMGHMVGASGAASLIKVIKAMEHKELAPIINFQTPNPYINFTDSPLYVNDTVRPWETDGFPRRAGISSFGFSRTNCHMIVEEAPELTPAPAGQPRYCLTISAKNEQAYRDYIQNYADHLEGGAWNLADLCYTSNIGRGHYEYRAALVASSKDELRRQIAVLAAQQGLADGIPYVFAGNHRIVSEKKTQLEPGELRMRERRQLNETAAGKLRDYLENGSSAASLLAEVCRLYAAGADVDWKAVYAGEKRRRIPVPVYPMQRIRYWAAPKITKVRSQAVNVLHPLVEEQLPAGAAGETVYETKFRIDRHWVLSDHRISKRAVLPGTTYLEMARFAAARAFGRDSVELRDIYFLVPMVVEEGAEVTARLTLSGLSGQSAAEPGGYAFTVSSLNQDGDWVPHVEGKLLPLAAAPDREKTDLAQLKSRADSVIDPFIGETDTGVFQFGPHWDTVRVVWQLGSETLAKLQLNAPFQPELGVYKLHPSVLDNAMNLLSQSTGATFLPFTYKSFRLYTPMTDDMYSHIRVHENKGGSGETITYDVDLLDGEGRVLAQVSGYTIKKVHDVSALGSGSVPGECMQMGWVLRELPAAEAEAASSETAGGPWALVAIAGSRADRLIDAIKTAGKHVLPFYLGAAAGAEGVYSPNEEGLDAMLAAAEQQGAQGILFAADYTSNDESLERLAVPNEAFRARRELSVDALFKLCKTMLARKSKWPAGLKVLVRQAWSVDGNEKGLSPLSAATAALARVIGQEYRHLQVDVVDVSDDVPATDAMNELFVYGGKFFRAVRPAGVFTQELRPHRIAEMEKLTLDTEAVYVITGGLGGLGLSIAGRLADKGMAKIVLLGRSRLASPEEWEELAASGEARYRALTELKPRLASLEYIPADAADGPAIERLGEELKARYGRIAGVFHAAGVAGDGFLMFKEEQRYQDVTRPKLEGTLALLRLLPEDGTGFLALFSSIAALTGGEGQGDYSAANAFLDTLADAGQLAGRRVISINWPSWKEVGMSVDFGVDEENNLFRPIAVADALDWLEWLIVHPQRSIIPGTLNKAAAVELAEELPFRLAAEFRASESRAGAATGGAGVPDVRIKGCADPTDTQRTLGAIFGAVLGLSEIDIFASFQDMGGNSLMATQLLKLIDEQFPGTVDISDLFSYPSVDDLAMFIDSKRPAAPAAAGKEQSGDAAERELMELVEKELEGSEFLELFKERNGR